MSKGVTALVLALVLQASVLASAAAQQQSTPVPSNGPASVGTIRLPQPAEVIRLGPNGTRRSTSISSVTVCDFTDFSGSLTDLEDICNLGSR
jgi:hypothetical protein